MIVKVQYMYMIVNYFANPAVHDKIANNVLFCCCFSLKAQGLQYWLLYLLYIHADSINNRYCILFLLLGIT